MCKTPKHTKSYNVIEANEQSSYRVWTVRDEGYGALSENYDIYENFKITNQESRC